MVGEIIASFFGPKGGKGTALPEEEQSKYEPKEDGQIK